MRIPRPIRSIALVFTLFAAGAGIGSVAANIARADDCLTAPNSTTPQGSHWYYRMDWANQRKCWYLRAPGEASQQRAQRVRPDAASTAQSTPAPDAGSPAAVAQAGAPRLATPNEDVAPAPRLKILSVKPRSARTLSAPTAEPARTSAPDASTAPPVSAARAPQASALPSSPQRSGPATAWPDPAPAMAAMAVASDNAGAASPRREADAGMSAELQNAVEPAPSTAAPATRRPAADTPLEMLLPVALGLVAAGILFRLVMKLAAARRGPVIVEYAEPEWSNDEYSEPRILDDQPQDARRQDDWQQADWRRHDRRQVEFAGDQFAAERTAQARTARSRPLADAARSRAVPTRTSGGSADDLKTTERVIMRALQRTRA